ncbi:MAG: hypothetical protein WBV10_14460 [Exiguobacterium marinum]|uniref:hypothetical protein n=1 Tax=Exiguobacterium marinum TaxID=273528 RepID=UPI003C3AAEC0
MIVKYVIDTNVIRGLSARSNDVDAQKHQKQCQYFWKKIKEDSNAILLIPEEVKVELDVQLLAEIPPKPNERQRILDAVNDCQIVHEKSTRGIENKLRELSATLKAKYGSRIHEECQITPQHMRVSDARILSAAYEQDGILVTRNIKDFILYLFLSEADEEVLYDTATGEYLSISTELHEAVLSDEEFSTRLEDFFEAWNQLD